MGRQVRGQVVVVCILAVLLLGAGVMAQSTTDFQIEPNAPTPIPSETVTYDGYTEQFTSVTTTMPGETIEVTAIGPAETGYIVHLAEDTDTSRRSTGAVGEEMITVDTDGLSPGTYALAVEHNGTVKASHPVVIHAYEIDQPTMITVKQNDSLSITITLSKSRDSVEDPNEVAVTLWTDSTEQSVTAEQINATTYEATFSADTVTENANITTEIYGTNERFDTRERLAVSEPSGVNVTATSTPTSTETATPTPTPSPTATDTATSTPNSAPSDQGSAPASKTTTTTTTATSTVSTEQAEEPRTSTPSPEKPTGTTVAPTLTRSETQTSGSITTTEDDSQNGVTSTRARTVTTNSENPATSSGTGHGLTVVQAGIAILLSIALLRRRR